MVTTAKLNADAKGIVGRQVLRLRTKAGLSQQELADHCGIFRTYLSRIENGSANVSVSVLAALATALAGCFCKTALAA